MTPAQPARLKWVAVIGGVRRRSICCAGFDVQRSGSDQLASLGVMPMAVHQQRWNAGRTLLRTPLGKEIERHFGFRQY